MWTCVSYYTDNYAEEAEQMLETAMQFEIQTVLYPIKQQGDWAKNCNYKSTIIKNVFSVCEGDILYVDADARFKSYPKLFDEIDCDIAFHRLNNPGDPNELLSGTLFFKNTPKTKEVIDAWEKECQDRPEVRDQKNLDKVLKSIPDVRVYLLPVEYCAIFDHPSVRGTEPVILHTQASRRLKRS